MVYDNSIEQMEPTTYKSTTTKTTTETTTATTTTTKTTTTKTTTKTTKSAAAATTDPIYLDCIYDKLEPCLGGISFGANSVEGDPSAHFNTAKLLIV